MQPRLNDDKREVIWGVVAAAVPHSLKFIDRLANFVQLRIVIVLAVVLVLAI